jgi:hypothetical protein
MKQAEEKKFFNKKYFPEEFPINFFLTFTCLLSKSRQMCLTLKAKQMHEMCRLPGFKNSSSRSRFLKIIKISKNLKKNLKNLSKIKHF